MINDYLNSKFKSWLRTTYQIDWEQFIVFLESTGGCVRMNPSMLHLCLSSLRQANLDIPNVLPETVTTVLHFVFPTTSNQSMSFENQMERLRIFLGNPVVMTERSSPLNNILRVEKSYKFTIHNHEVIVDFLDKDISVEQTIGNELISCCQAAFVGESSSFQVLDLQRQCFLNIDNSNFGLLKKCKKTRSIGLVKDADQFLVYIKRWQAMINLGYTSLHVLNNVITNEFVTQIELLVKDGATVEDTVGDMKEKIVEMNEFLENCSVPIKILMFGMNANGSMVDYSSLQMGGLYIQIYWQVVDY